MLEKIVETARIALHAFLIAATALWLFPLLWAVYAALRPVSETIFNGYLSWPKTLNFGNFTTVWTQADLPYFYLNTLVIVVPGVILFTRWSLAVPVVMLEGLGPRAAMKRSTALVKGHGWAVFRVLLNVTILAGLSSLAIQLPLVKVFGSAHASFGLWASLSIAGAITTPYAAHALSVVYYRLTDPDRPLLPEPQSRWQSIWHQHEQHSDTKL